MRSWGEADGTVEERHKVRQYVSLSDVLSPTWVMRIPSSKRFLMMWPLSLPASIFKSKTSLYSLHISVSSL